MNNEVLDIYGDLTDDETDELFSTPKESRKGDRLQKGEKKSQD